LDKGRAGHGAPQERKDVGTQHRRAERRHGSQTTWRSQSGVRQERASQRGSRSARR
jgi:hypothetical protein